MPNPQDGRTACLTAQDGIIACLSPQDRGNACLTPRVEHCMPLPTVERFHALHRRSKTACLTSQEEDFMPHVAGSKAACLSTQNGRLQVSPRRIGDCIPLPTVTRLHALHCRRKTACLTSQEEDCMPYIAGGRLHASRRRMEGCISAPQQDGRLHALTR
jgi:hypothetical protein